jgi:hypothetical protein
MSKLLDSEFVVLNFLFLNSPIGQASVPAKREMELRNSFATDNGQLTTDA